MVEKPYLARARECAYREGMLDLGSIRTVGRAAKPLEAALVRELVRDDLVLLDGEKGSKPPSVVKRLSDRHHALARNLAGGMKVGEAAAVVGMDISRVSILKSDPAFKELVEFYRGAVDAQYVQLHETLAGMSLDAALIVRERMEEEPDKIQLGTLLEIAKMGADRTGHGPSSKQEVAVNVNLGSRLEEARKRIAERRKVIDVTPNEDAA